MEYFIILTLELPGRQSVTISTGATASDGLTRKQVLEDMQRIAAEKYGSQWANATVIFFSVEPSAL